MSDTKVLDDIGKIKALFDENLDDAARLLAKAKQLISSENICLKSVKEFMKVMYIKRLSNLFLYTNKRESEVRIPSINESFKLAVDLGSLMNLTIDSDNFNDNEIKEMCKVLVIDGYIKPSDLHNELLKLAQEVLDARTSVPRPDYFNRIMGHGKS